MGVISKPLSPKQLLDVMGLPSSYLDCVPESRAVSSALLQQNVDIAGLADAVEKAMKECCK